jgi:Zn finger protein HypA/HybF involved in hydrogenase expression
LLSDCKECHVQPEIQAAGFYEVNLMYRLICPNCGKHTRDISQDYHINSEKCTQQTFDLLTTEWAIVNM